MQPTSTTTSIDEPAAPGGVQREPSAAEQAQTKASELTDQAQEKAQQAAGQAKGKLREQIDQRSQQAGEQINQQAADLRAVSDSLREQGKDGPANAAGKLAEYAQKVGGYLHEKDADTLLAEAEDFGRRQPWALAAGALAVGFAASRLLKASSSRRYSERRSQVRGPERPPSTAFPPGPHVAEPSETVTAPLASRTPSIGQDTGAIGQDMGAQ